MPDPQSSDITLQPIVCPCCL